MVDWKRGIDQVAMIDKAKSGKGGRPRKNPIMDDQSYYSSLSVESERSEAGV